MTEPFTFSFLNFGPKFWIEGDRLVARTSLFLQLLTLFSYSRLVVVDRGAGRVAIRNRYLWILHGRSEIAFDDVEHVSYRYAGVPTLEMYVVALALANRPPVNLFTFVGTAPDPSEYLPLDVDLVSLRGDQQDRSLDYVRLLMSYLGVPLGPRLGRRRRRPAS